ncbi:MAG: leucine-rich repeat domain-containing protein [Oscillospiraceae bacterium]|nr:leucine-rich repeat domain-containing protein [Oscillospiraceae bacterium]
MKKILSLIFFIVLCMPLAACNQAENIDDNSENSSLPASQTASATVTDTPAEPDQSISDEYQFAVNSDNTITITKYTGEDGDVEIPSEIDGKKVSAIGNTFEETGAFQDCTTLTSVIIPDGVTEIQDNAFQGCTSLKTVTIPASVTLLRNCAFDNCPNLQSIYFEGDAPQIADYVLYPPLPTIYYHEGAVGWTNPWYSCPAETY